MHVFPCQFTKSKTNLAIKRQKSGAHICPGSWHPGVSQHNTLLQAPTPLHHSWLQPLANAEPGVSDGCGDGPSSWVSAIPWENSIEPLASALAQLSHLGEGRASRSCLSVSFSTIQHSFLENQKSLTWKLIFFFMPLHFGDGNVAWNQGWVSLEYSTFLPHLLTWLAFLRKTAPPCYCASECLK